ncbi:hypothetical protein EIN_135630 [Entamoeba invadens IP1]|uniref:Uncharacterized protein n=1 Tax=Entamoeba invadens IP1 TaxID=370355 RepID=A0A0A1U320_ENTIV|nr:hypothetical protein EIN_135630 [Entamoeba invadens IP1]ELP85949.1 hypothetical protein EIN_135630 [Entamoeba invadens IP1]|eukprot:XP_004185295.1 hypothetical protein EIN_135630 [Entamoeba invadens IP1]
MSIKVESHHVRSVKKLLRYAFAPKLTFLPSKLLRLQLDETLPKIFSEASPLTLIGTTSHPVVLCSLFPDIHSIQKNKILPDSYDKKYITDWYASYRWGASVEPISDPTENTGYPIAVVLACSDTDCNGDTVSALAGLSTDEEQLVRLKSETSEKIYMCFSSKDDIKFRTQWKYTITVNINEKSSIENARKRLVDMVYEIANAKLRDLEETEQSTTGVIGLMRGFFTDAALLQEQKERSTTYRNIHMQIGDLAYSIGNYIKAIENYTKALPEFSSHLRQQNGCHEMLGYSLFMVGKSFAIHTTTAFEYFMKSSLICQNAADSDFCLAKRIGMNFGAMVKGKRWEDHFEKVIQMPNLSPLFSALIHEQIGIHWIDSCPRKSAMFLMIAANQYFSADERLGGFRCTQKETDSLALILQACDAKIKDNNTLALYPPIGVIVNSAVSTVAINEIAMFNISITNQHNSPLKIDFVRLDIESGEKSESFNIDADATTAVTVKCSFQKVGISTLQGVYVNMYNYTIFVPFADNLKVKVTPSKIPIQITVDTPTNVFTGEIVQTTLTLENIINSSLQNVVLKITPGGVVCGGVFDSPYKKFNINELNVKEKKSITVEHLVTKESEHLSFVIEAENQNYWEKEIWYSITSPLLLQSQLMGRITSAQEVDVRFEMKSNKTITLLSLRLLSKTWSNLRITNNLNKNTFSGKDAFEVRVETTQQLKLTPFDVYFNDIQTKDFSKYDHLALQYLKMEYPTILEEVVDNVCMLFWKCDENVCVSIVDFVPAILHRNNQTYPYQFVHNQLLQYSKVAQLSKHTYLLAALHTSFVGHFVQFPEKLEYNLLQPIPVAVHFFNTTKLIVHIKLFASSPLNPLVILQDMKDMPVSALWYGPIGDQCTIEPFVEKVVDLSVVFLSFGEHTLPPIYWRYAFEEHVWSDPIPLNIYLHSINLLQDVEQLGCIE